jgi:hypothetical protein
MNILGIDLPKINLAFPAIVKFKNGQDYKTEFFSSMILTAGLVYLCVEYSPWMISMVMDEISMRGVQNDS